MPVIWGTRIPHTRHVVVVGAVPDGMADTPRAGWSRRLELPFRLEVAAA